MFGGVYKLAAIEKDGEIIPKIKISENIEKITNPGFKSVYRLYDKDTDKAVADVITLDGEKIPEGSNYEIFDPDVVWKRKTVSNFYAKNLRKQIFKNGEQVYEPPKLEDIKNYCSEQISTLWEEMLRFENPHEYYVDLSRDLWELKTRLLEQANK